MAEPERLDARIPVSIVCVYNDPDVLESCLARSVRSSPDRLDATELLAIDNRSGDFTTAGGALNHGARESRNEVVVFVHQDVYLHSLPELERAAAELLHSEDIGLMGAVGVDGRSRVIGRVRDRVVPIGSRAADPRDVETLDEVLFLIRKDRVLAEPLSEEPKLAWHAYAVEYALRVRRSGLRVVARDVELTHNSLSTNLKDLDIAHRTVGDAFPELLPIHTTCGVVHRTDRERGLGRVVRRSRGATVWLRESIEAARMGVRAPVGDVALADIRMLVDEALELGGMSSLRVIELDEQGQAGDAVQGLDRLGRSYAVVTLDRSELAGALRQRPDREAILVTNLARDDVALVLDALPGTPHVVGLSEDTGRWVLVGIDEARLARLWPRRRNRPFGGLLPARRGAESDKVRTAAREAS